jgi:hypothetical protein
MRYLEQKWLDQEAILPISPPLNADSKPPEQSTRGLALFFVPLFLRGLKQVVSKQTHLK